MPILTNKPTAPTAEERYENGRMSRINGRQLYEDQGVNTKLLGIKNSKIYTINENQGFFKTLFGRRPAKITRITGTRFTQPDTVYVETPGSYPGVLVEPRIATKINLDEYNTMQKRFNTAYSVARKQLGGTMDAEQQELQLALMGYIVATKKQPKDENEINQLAQALVQLKQQDPKQFAQLVQLGQQAQALKAEKGAKLNYIKSLKGQCPDGEELVYFKKGGMIGCGCQKKEKIEQPKKANAVEEFKKGRKTKKC